MKTTVSPNLWEVFASAHVLLITLRSCVFCGIDETKTTTPLMTELFIWERSGCWWKANIVFKDAVFSSVLTHESVTTVGFIPDSSDSTSRIFE